MQGINFIAIDFETATANVLPSVRRASAWCVTERLWKPVRGLSVRKEIVTVIGTCRFTVSDRMIQKTLRNFRKYGRKSVNTLKIYPYLWLTMPLSTSVASVTRWNYTVWRSRTSPIIVPSVPHAKLTVSVAIVWIIFATSSRYLMDSTTGQAMMRRCVHGCFCRNWRMPGANWKKWIIAMVNYRENDY